MILRMVRWKDRDGDTVKVTGTNEIGHVQILEGEDAIRNAMRDTGPDTEWLVGDWRSGAADLVTAEEWSKP